MVQVNHLPHLFLALVKPFIIKFNQVSMSLHLPLLPPVPVIVEGAELPTKHQFVKSLMIYKGFEPFVPDCLP